MYETDIPAKSVMPSELMSLKLVKESSKNENAVESADINTASFDFISSAPPCKLPRRKIE